MAFTSNCADAYRHSLREIAPLIAERREQFDRDRKLPDDVHAALAEAGLFRLWLPKALGGPELSPIDFMAVVEAASALDGSVGWLVGNGGGMSRAGGYLPESVARELLADPRAFIVSATGAVGNAVPVAGGYRVSGRWPFGSGAHHATWFMGLASVKGAGGMEEPAICCHFPRGDVLIHDTWHVSGLRGTGSCDFEARDLFVPAERVHRLIDHAPTQPGLIYRMPSLSAYAWTVGTVPLGIARGSIEAFSKLASRRSRAGTAALLRDRETVQATVGRATALHEAGRAFLIAAMTDVTALMDHGGEKLVEARLKLRVACAHAAESALRIVDMLAAEAGTAAIFESGTLERCVRDVQAAAKHVAMGPHIYVARGRTALGLDPGPAKF